MGKQAKKQNKTHPPQRKKLVYIVYFVLRLSVVLMLIAQFFNHNYENVLLCLLTLVLFMLPSAFERRLRINLPDTLEIIILLFIYAAEILGEIRSFYVVFPHWDDILHTMNGFLCAAIGFALVDILNREERVSLNLSPFFMAVTAFCFSMTIGVLWEFFEFAMDQLLRFDMQKDTVLNTISTVTLDPDHGTQEVVIRGITGTLLELEDGRHLALGLGGYLDIGLIDTMKDLFVNFIGAVVFSAIGFFYVRGRGKSRIAPKFIPQVLDDQSSKKDQIGRIFLPLPGNTTFVSDREHKEEITMYEQTNPSIKCTVNSCAFHKNQHCTLNEIQVGCCQNSVGQSEETECASFKLGDHGTNCGC